MIDDRRMPALRRRVSRWYEANRFKILVQRKLVPLYVHDDDSLGVRGELQELVGVYDHRAEIARVVEDVVQWYAESHPLGQGVRVKSNTAPKRQSTST
jgi:hypothetical protein